MHEVRELDERPTAAGVYDYSLGGTTNTEADRRHAEMARQMMPDIFLAAWANRGFLQRAVRWLATEGGIRQFIDLGAGFPTQGNTHEVVASCCPDGRVVYVDNDPRVVKRASELIAGVPGTATILADIRRPDEILTHPETRRLIEFAQPVAVLAVAVTHYLTDADDPWGVVSRYLDPLVPGSYLALSTVTRDRQEERWDELIEISARSQLMGAARTLPETKRFFDGLEIVPPYPGASADVAFIGLWGAEDPELADDEGSRFAYAAVARKP